MEFTLTFTGELRGGTGELGDRRRSGGRGERRVHGARGARGARRAQGARGAPGARQGNIIQLSQNLTRIYFGLNLSFLFLSVCLSDLLIGVGFVTGLTFKTHVSNVNFIDLLPRW